MTNARRFVDNHVCKVLMTVGSGIYVDTVDGCALLSTLNVGNFSLENVSYPPLPVHDEEGDDFK